MKQDDYLLWLQSKSMLEHANRLAEIYSGKGAQWHVPYASPRPEEVCKMAPAWFTAYPWSTIPQEGQSIIQCLGDRPTWQLLSEIGFKAMHAGPMKMAGGVLGRNSTPTVDGGFDRISFEIDPAFGSEVDYVHMVDTAAEYGAVVIGDLVPGHTGKGSDFRLAERHFGDYAGMYHMVEIHEQDWNVLPPVAPGEDSVSLSNAIVTTLKQKGYLVGVLEKANLEQSGTSVSHWDATPVIAGADGKLRRWAYLHYFKRGQPTLNWLDPSYAAQRVVAGEIVQSRAVLGDKIMRLDTNGFLGIECCEGDEAAWSEGHPLSVDASNMLAMMVRKLGGYSFQELNLCFEDYGRFGRWGADLSYDFVTRPAFCQALLTHDAEFLRLTLRLLHEYSIRPNSLVHALQNHDEITYELVHFARHSSDLFHYRGTEMTGKRLRELTISEALASATGAQAPYNRAWENGICTTMVGICAAATGVTNPYDMTSEEKALVRKAHVLLTLYNAMQPGVLAVSGWDFVGALPLRPDCVAGLIADGDNRWLNRGAYDLTGAASGVSSSPMGVPRADVVYGTIGDQLEDSDSYASQLKRIIQVRTENGIHMAEQLEIPAMVNNSVAAMIHRLPNNHVQVTALNFGGNQTTETLALEGMSGCEVYNLLADRYEGKVTSSDSFELKLDGFEGKALLLV